ncbi:MAG: dTDP-4-dehydrorhamnose reductase [Bacilli bacterium]|nr:dTDP-4-dehydrorhamnose reductase [Bacilli bacterium]
MKYLITGSNGQLGHDIALELKKRGYEDFLQTDVNTFTNMDITNKEEVEKIVLDYNPDVIFHCAAYTAVDKAETDKDLCYNINVIGTKNMTEAALKTNSKIIYISTDYVFDGTKKGIYKTSDIPNPNNQYGITKRQGELEALRSLKSFVVRTSWVFGINGNNFVKTMLKLAQTKSELTVVSDQIGSPTYTVDLSKLLVDMSETDKYGIYHATNTGFMSWYEFAKIIFEINNIDIKVNPISTANYSTTAAKRPLNSMLSKEKLKQNGFDELPTIEAALKRYNKELILTKK